MQLTAAIVGPAHGLRGEVILDVRSDDPEVLTPGAHLEVAGRGAVVTVRSIRVHKDRVLASFEECVRARKPKRCVALDCLWRSTRKKTPGIRISSRGLQPAHRVARCSALSAA